MNVLCISTAYVSLICARAQASDYYYKNKIIINLLMR